MTNIPKWLVDEVKKKESFYSKPYWDVRQWSVGYGSKASGPHDVVDRAEADRRLAVELGKAAGYVDKHKSDLPEGIRGALISLTYNAGPKWTKQGLGKAVTNGQWGEARSRFVQYTSPDPKYQRGLRNRRLSEAKWFEGVPKGGDSAPAYSNSSDAGSGGANVAEEYDSAGKIITPEKEDTESVVLMANAPTGSPEATPPAPPPDSPPPPTGNDQEIQGTSELAAYIAASKQNFPAPVDPYVSQSAPTPPQEPVIDLFGNQKASGLPAGGLDMPEGGDYKIPEPIELGDTAPPSNYGSSQEMGTYGTQPEVNMAPQWNAKSLGDVEPTPAQIAEGPNDRYRTSEVVLPWEKFEGQERAIQRRAFMSKHGYDKKGYSDDEVREIEARAQHAEDTRLIDAPSQFDPYDLMPEASLREQLDWRASRAPFATKMAEGTTWKKLLYADFVQRNSLVNTAEEAVLSWWSEARNRIDPDFTVGAEQLKQFPEQYHEYLLRANNSEDYLYREYEIKSRMEGEKVAQQAWNESTAMGLTSYALSTVPQIALIFAQGGGAYIAASRLVGVGTSYVGRLASLSAAESALIAPELLYGRKAGVLDDNQVALGFLLTGLGSAWGARGLRNAKLERQHFELAQRIAQSHADMTPNVPDKHQDFSKIGETNSRWTDHTSRMAFNRAKDPMSAHAPPRPIVDANLSVEVPRSAEGLDEAVKHFEADAGILRNFVTLAEAGTHKMKQAMRQAVEEVFDRQGHVMNSNVSGYIAIPRSFKGTPEEFLAGAGKKNQVTYLRKEAAVSLADSGGRLIKVSVPKGSKVLDLDNLAGAPKGAFAVRLGKTVPKVKTSKGTKPKPGTPIPYHQMKLKDVDGRPVMKGGKQAEFTQYNVVHEGEMVVGAAKQYLRLVTNDGLADPLMMVETNSLKRIDPDIEHRPPDDGVPDALLNYENGYSPGSNSSVGASQGSPVYRERLNNVTEDVKQIRQNAHLFEPDTAPALIRIPVVGDFFKAFMPSGVRNMKDSNYLLVSMMGGVLERGFNRTAPELAKGLGTQRTIDRVAVEIISATDGKIMKSAVDNFNKYAKAVGGRNFMKANMLQDELIKRFGKEVNDYRLALEQTGFPPHKEVPPGIAEHSADLDKIYDQFLTLANDPGIWIGKPRKTTVVKKIIPDDNAKPLTDEFGNNLRDENGKTRYDTSGDKEVEETIIDGFEPLEGFEDEAVQRMRKKGWTPRVWMGDAIADAEFRTGDGHILEKWLSGSLMNGILKDEKFMEWAASRAGIDKTRWKDKMGIKTKAELDKVNDIMKEHADVIARAMADTIKRSKAGWSPQIDLINGNGSGRKFVEMIRSELKKRGTDMPDDLSELFDNILWKTDNLKDGKSGRHSFNRAILQNDFVLPAGDKGITIRDFVSTDATQNARGYVRRMGGRIAWGSYEYVSPDGLYVVKGIRSDQDFQDRIVHPIMEIETEIARKSNVLLPQGKPETQMQLEAAWEYTTGNTPVGTVGLQAIQNYSYMSHLGNAGFAQAQELANIIAYTGLRGIADTSGWKDMMTRLRYGKAAQEELSAMGMMFEDEMGLGTDIMRGALGQSADERMGLGVGGKMATALDRGARFVFISSGLAPLQQEMQRTMARGLFNKFAGHAHNHASFSAMPRRLQNEFVEIAGNRDMAEKIFGVLKNNGVVEPKWWGQHLKEFTQDGIDEAAFYQLKHGIKRFTEQGIQNNSYGTQHRFMNYPLVRAVLTLKSFLYGSITKQLIRHGREIATHMGQLGGDLKAGNMSAKNGAMDSVLAMAPAALSIVLQLALGAGMYVASKELAMLGLREDDKEEKREKLYEMKNLAQAGLIRSGTLGLIPTVWNTPVQYAAPDYTVGLEGYKGSGLDGDILSLPAAGQIRRALKLGGEAGGWALNGFEGEMSMKQMTQTHKLLISQMQVQWITNFVGSQLLEMEPE